MKSVGERLRRERLQRGIDIPALAKLTRISSRYLEAIESGSMEELPSGFFYRSFVRQYATALDLNVPEIEAELERAREAESSALDAALEHATYSPKPADPIVTETNRRGNGKIGGYVALLAVVLIACSAFYAWWHRLETASAARRDGLIVETASARPAPQEPLPKPAPSNDTATAGLSPAPGVPLTPVGSAPLAPKMPDVSPDDKVVIKIAATEETWIAITADGKTIFSGLLQPAQEIVLGGKQRAFIRVGNAGGLAVSWNGKTIGPVGARGQVRNVLLTPESYRIMAPGDSL